MDGVAATGGGAAAGGAASLAAARWTAGLPLRSAAATQRGAVVGGSLGAAATPVALEAETGRNPGEGLLGRWRGRGGEDVLRTRIVCVKPVQ